MNVAPLLFLILCHLGSNQPLVGPTAIPSGSVPVRPKSTPGQTDKMTDAERVSRLQRAMDDERKEMEKLKSQLDDPMSDYAKSQADFQKLDGKMEERKKALEEAKAKAETAQVQNLEKELPDLQKQWQLAKDRFNLLFEERKTIQQKIAALDEKLKQDQKTLDQLTGKVATPASKPKNDKPENKTPETVAKASDPPATPKPPIPSPTPVLPQPPEPPVVGPEIPIIGKLTKAKDKKASQELNSAKQDAQSKEAEAKKAIEKVASVSQRLATLKKNVALEQKLLESARRKLDNVQKTIAALQAEEREQKSKGASKAALSKIQRKIEDEREREEEISDEVRKITARLTDLQEELNVLQADQIAALRVSDQKNEEAAAARQKVAELQNPYTIKNVLQWLIDRGPVLVLILVCTWLFNRLVRLLNRRLVMLHVRTSRRKSKEREVEQRAVTLAGVLSNFSAILIYGGGALMFLSVINVPIVPLMGGAAVFGLAVAFGAQNMIRDYFTGFMILIEDQYGVKDVIKIGATAGQVERITLRMTVLRDLEGVLHFIPHGTITQVSNLTHSWSRALFDVGVAYKENVDHVIDVIRELGSEMRADPTFGPMITEDLEMLGVNSFDDSAVTIRFFLKTRPLKQWYVKREMLRRIKNRFDALGIEIPFPHRTVYHRAVENVQLDAQSSEAA